MSNNQGRWYRQMQRDKAKVNAENLYTPLEDFDWSFSLDEIDTIKEQFLQGAKVSAIAEQLQRESEEIFIMLIDLAYRKIIKFRGMDDDD